MSAAPERFNGRIHETVVLSADAGVTVIESAHYEVAINAYVGRACYSLCNIPHAQARRIGELLIACADESVATDPRVSATDSCDSPPLGAGLDPNAQIHDEETM